MDRPASIVIDPERASFIESAVMIIVGTCDDALRLRIARAAGAIVDPATGGVDLVVSDWQWPETIANIRLNGRVAATFARPSDYVSYQVKGRAVVIPESDDHRTRAKRYVEAMTACLVGNGLDLRSTIPWLVDREPLVLRLAPDMIFVQTPGDTAGRRLEPSR